MVGVRLQSLSTDGSTIHLHFLNSDLYLKGREILSRDNTYIKLLTTDRKTLGTTDFYDHEHRTP